MSWIRVTIVATGPQITEYVFLNHDIQPANYCVNKQASKWSLYRFTQQRLQKKLSSS